MAECIPFVFTKDDCKIVASTFSDSQLVRVPVVNVKDFADILPPKARLWVDPLIDGFHDASGSKWDWWEGHVKKAPHHNELSNPTFVARPDQGKLNAIVSHFLDECLAHKPAAITVPQLPLVKNVSRNKLNWGLAKACGAWQVRTDFRGQLILPIIVTHQDQINLGTARKKKISAVEKSYNLSNASGYWAVDSTLADQAGSPTFQKKRFPAIIDFHRELDAAIPGCSCRIAGPYWGMNLVLWSRNLVDSPAISIGRSFQYFLSGGRGNPAKVRIAIPSLRRWVQINPEFRDWLTSCAKLLGTDSTAFKELPELQKKYSDLQTKAVARRQIAEFYKEWVDEIAATDAPGRALALYQDFSSAYVLGKALPRLPLGEKTARRPERVAEYLMLSCL